MLNHGYNLDAMYLAGYTIECSLKALILESTPASDKQAMLEKIGSGKTIYNPETLGGILKDLGKPIPVELVRRCRRSHWTTDLRYEIGRRDTRERHGRS